MEHEITKFAGRGKKRNAESAHLLLEDSQSQLKPTLTSSTEVSTSQPFDINQVDWVRAWEQQQAATNYQNAQINKRTHGGEKRVQSPSKRGLSRAKTETISSFPKYILFLK